MAAPVLQPVHLGFNPTRQDVQIAGLILMGLQLKATPGRLPPGRLPPELALSILAHAVYQPRITSSRAEEIEYRANDFWQPGPQASVAALYLTTKALPPYFRRASRVTLQMRSADQGWATFGGDGTYDNSHTWFEACILRPVPGGGGAIAAAAASPVPVGWALQWHPLEMQLPQTFRNPGYAKPALEHMGWYMVDHNGRDTWMVHHNITASRDLGNYRVDWVAGMPTDIEDPRAIGDGEGFLSALMPGDKIALWARAE
ncbi:hypothetical protein diail_5778, partial [Diaporthe ilicicola]